MAKQPHDAPLYYVGNTASSLKFYSPLPNNSWIFPGDPVASGYEFLDINSAMPVGFRDSVGELMNPGPCTDDAQEGVYPNFFRAPTFTAVTVQQGKVTFATYMTGFNPNTNLCRERHFYARQFGCPPLEQKLPREKPNTLDTDRLGYNRPVSFVREHRDQKLYGRYKVRYGRFGRRGTEPDRYSYRWSVALAGRVR